MQARTKIFLVDDHPIVRTGMTKLIELTDDLTVCGEAGDRATGLAGMLATRPQVALVDLSLGDSSGLDLLVDLRAQGLRIRSLVVTMWQDLSHARRALEAGAAGYLMKSEATTTLLPAIRTVRDGRPYLPPNLAVQLAMFPAAGTDPIACLSHRELEVFTQLGAGRSAGEIAVALGVVTDTVYDYCERIQLKLGVTGIRELRRVAVRWYAGQWPG